MSHEEPRVVNALAELCKKHDVKCLIQVGAEDGYEASMVQIRTGCRAIVIEANPGAIACSAQLEFHHLIVGASDAPTSFYFNKDPALSGHFPRETGDTEVQTWQLRLDTFCGQRAGLQPDALIIDTEGTTMEVLEGCGQLLAGVNVVYAEVQSEELRPGIRLVGEVDRLLTQMGMRRHEDLPSYGTGVPRTWTVGDQPSCIGGGQFNMTWVRR